MSLFNIFSNLWFYFGDSNGEPGTQIKKIKAIHQVSNIINLDKELEYWLRPFSEYPGEIREQILINKHKKLTAIFNGICAHIDRLHIDTASSILIFSVSAHECLIALYIYYLHKKCGLTLEQAATTLVSKITGLDYTLGEDLKKWLYYACSSQSTTHVK